MEPKVIEEIAEQLGMAVSEASKFVEGILPQYAGLQAMENGVLAVFALVVFAACAAVALKSVKAIADLKKQKLGYYEYSDKADPLWTAFAIACPIGFAAMIFAVVSGIEAIDWALFPDAKLVEMAIEAVR